MGDLRGVACAARVEPAGAARSGGDWVEVIGTADGQVAAVIGDVAGHGPEAAPAQRALAAASRQLIRTARTPAAALVALDSAVSRLPGHVLSTVCVLLLDSPGGELLWSSAGHFPPLLCTTTGAGFLPGEADLPLGVRPKRRADHHSSIARGDRLVLFTDGLIERRGQPLDHSMSALRAAAASGPTGTGRLLRHLLATMSPGRGDDTAVLVLGVTAGRVASIAAPQSAPAHEPHRDRGAHEQHRAS